MSFERGLQAINIHGTGRPRAIHGLSIQTESGTYYAGSCEAAPESMTLDAPDERLDEMEVQLSHVYSPAVTFRTNYDHEISSERTRGYRILGIYFRLDEQRVYSIGLIMSSESEI
ncbi:hypothetical protein BDW42DRAFT_189820 [Aspergillus taichungensis]|uniref:Uncharacterized protein n=1 Tax=Aspergillus taichungensis TaxID=482145 RepID=A0A2J5I9Z4_9EURO|nr:hypothetical protein BDW42DRAFT_189820 [Aspergillus taichungensis]